MRAKRESPGKMLCKNRQTNKQNYSDDEQTEKAILRKVEVEQRPKKVDSHIEIERRHHRGILSTFHT